MTPFEIGLAHAVGYLILANIAADLLLRYVRRKHARK